MDPEIIEQLNEQLREMTELLAQQNGTMASLTSAILNQNNAINQNAAAIKNNASAINEDTAAAKAHSDKQRAYDLANAESNKKSLEAEQAKQIAIHGSIGALKSFHSALTSTERGFSKYGSMVSGMGDAAWDAGKKLGPLGAVAGAVAKALGFVLDASFKQADAMNNFADSWKKVGAIGGMTNEKLLDMAQAAGYASQDLERLRKPLETLGQASVNIGGTAASGQQAFMKIIDISDQAQKKFNRLGFQLEEVNEMQAEYIKLQALSGRTIASSVKDQEKLKKSSLEYADNLIELAAITGKDVDSVKKQQEIAYNEYQEQLLQIEDQRKLNELKKRGNDADAQAEIARIENRMKARDKLKQDTDALFGQDMGAQIRDYIRSGGRVSEENVGAYRAGGAELEQLRQMQERGASPEEIEKQEHILRDAMAKRIQGYVRDLGGTMQVMNAKQAEELGRQFGITPEMAKVMGQIGEKGSAAAAEEAAAAKAKAEKEGFDKAADTRADLTLIEQKAKVALDDLLQTVNPLTGSFVGLAAAAAFAATALGVLAAGSLAGGLGGLLKGLGGLLGKGPGAAGARAAGAAGAGAAGAGAGMLAKGAKFAKGAAAAGAIFYGADALVGAAGVGKGLDADKIKKQDDENWKRASTWEKIQSSLPRGIEHLGRFLFMDNLANQAQADRVKKETEYLKKTYGTNLTTPGGAPKPAPSTPTKPTTSTDSVTANARITTAFANSVTAFAVTVKAFATSVKAFADLISTGKSTQAKPADRTGPTVNTSTISKVKPVDTTAKPVDITNIVSGGSIDLSALTKPFSISVESFGHSTSAYGNITASYGKITSAFGSIVASFATSVKAFAQLVTTRPIENKSERITIEPQDKALSTREYDFSAIFRVFDSSVASFGSIVASFATSVKAFADIVTVTNPTAIQPVATDTGNNNLTFGTNKLGDQERLERITGKRQRSEVELAQLNLELYEDFNDFVTVFNLNLDSNKKAVNDNTESFKYLTEAIDEFIYVLTGETREERKRKKDEEAAERAAAGESGGGGHYTGVGGNAASEQAMKFFTDRGYTKEQAAGIVGNLQTESGNFDPAVISGARKGDNGKAVGIAQWHPDRQAKFREVFGRDLEGSTLEQQLEFVAYELKNNERSAGDKLSRAKTASEAAAVVDQYYERSDGTTRGQRMANAQALLRGPSGGVIGDLNKTGGALQEFNKSLGGSADIVSLGKQLQSQGFRVDEHSAFGGVTRGAHKGAGHREDRAIDVNVVGGRDVDDPRAAKKLDALAAQLSSNPNLTVLWRTKGHYDHMHIETKRRMPKAAKGGIFDGPTSGYPVELHGNEVVAPLKKDSVLMKLADTPQKIIEKTAGDKAFTNDVSMEETTSMFKRSNDTVSSKLDKFVEGQNEMIFMMVNKLESLIDEMTTSNKHTKKILRNQH